MSDVHEMMPGFHEELIKEAAPWAQLGRRLLQSKRLGGVSAGMGAGSAVGAIGGAALQGVGGYQEARDVGMGGVQSALHGLSRGIGGAAKGALLGAGAGGVAGAIKPSMVGDLVKRKGILGPSARFGQRQLHGLTGWTPKGGIESIRGGAWQAKQNVDEIRKSLTKATPKAKKGLEKELAKARKGEGAAVQAQRMGLTSLPGYARSMAKRPIKTLKAGLKEQWQTSGPIGRGLVFGFPAVTIGGELARPSQPGEPGRVARAARNVGDIAYSLGPLPIGSQMALGTALSAAGGQTGKLLSRKKKRRDNAHIPAPPGLDPAGGDAVAGETIVTERAMGGPGASAA